MSPASATVYMKLYGISKAEHHQLPRLHLIFALWGPHYYGEAGGASTASPRFSMVVFYEGGTSVMHRCMTDSIEGLVWIKASGTPSAISHEP